jgi:hypothetical protein
VTTSEPDKRAWLPYLGFGAALVVIGEIIVGAARSNASGGLTSGERHAEVFAAVIMTIGAIFVLVGVIALGVTVALSGLGLGLQPATDEEPAPPVMRPAQSGPDELVLDPDPFAPHVGDSDVVARVRRGCAQGSRPMAIRRAVTTAARAGQVSDADRSMVEGLLAESARRPLGPVRPSVR